MILKLLIYILLFLIVTFLVYWHKKIKEGEHENYWKEHSNFIDIFILFIIQLIMAPISFILGVYGIKTKSYPDGV